MNKFLIFIGILIIFLICLNTKSLSGGAPFSIGTRVNTNPLLTEAKEKLIVLDSDNKYSKVRSRSGEVSNIRNDFLMMDSVDLCPKFQQRLIINEGYSCWLDTAMTAFIVPDEIFIFFQEAVYNKKNNDRLSPQDSKVVNVIQQYIDTLRYSVGYKELKTGIGTEMISALSKSTLSLCDSVLMRTFKDMVRSSTTGALNTVLFVLFLNEFLKMKANIIAPIENQSAEYTQNMFKKRARILILASLNDNNLIMSILTLPDYYNYALASIIVEMKIPKAEVTLEDYLDERKSNLFVSHVLAIVKCNDKWIYYNDNGSTITLDDPINLFKNIFNKVWLQEVRGNNIIDWYDLVTSIILIFTYQTPRARSPNKVTMRMVPTPNEEVWE